MGRKATGLIPKVEGMAAGLPKDAYPFFRFFIYKNGSKGWVFMFLRKTKAKYLSVSLAIAAILFLYPQEAKADSASIKGAMKIQRMGGYVILINYETRDKWTDNILFRVHCRFREGEFTFTSSSLNNIERGWHKTQIAISDVIRKRYGSLREYKIDLYRNGILIDTKKSY